MGDRTGGNDMVTNDKPAFQGTRRWGSFKIWYDIAHLSIGEVTVHGRTTVYHFTPRDLEEYASKGIRTAGALMHEVTGFDFHPVA